MAVFPNKYEKTCNGRGCGKRVRVGEGFIQKINGGWVTWCRDCCPERIAPAAARPAPRRVLTAQGHVLTPYEPDNLALVRSFPGARFHGNKDICPVCNTRHGECFWSVSLAQADRERVLQIADELKLDVAPELRNIVVTEQAQNATMAGLYPYQVTGVNWLSKQDYALLGDEMGLGKTIQTLVALPNKARVLVVAPNSLKYNWRDEAAKWRTDYTCTVINGGANFRTPRQGEILVVNYECLPDFLMPPARKKGKGSWQENARQLQAHYDILRSQHPDLCECIVVVDEAHKVKGMDTQRGQKVCTLTHICKKGWGLTGTPLLNKALDLWGVLVNLNLERRAFGNAHGEYAYPNFQRAFNCTKEYIRGARREVLQWGEPTPEVPEKMRRVMLQRKRTAVLPDLPTKTYTEILVSLDDVPGASHIKKELDSLWGEWGTLMDEKEDLPPFTAFSLVREKLARLCVPALMEYVENCEEQEVNLVVATAHLAPLDALLGREGWAVISGETKPEDRQTICNNQRAGRLRGVGCSITAAGVGLNLTGASRMVFVDLDWVPANNWQMEDRICRIGQTANKCEIVRFVVDHPLCRHIHKLLAKKIALIAAAIDGKAQATVPTAPVAPARQGESEEEFAARMKRVAEAEAEYDRQQAEKLAAAAKAEGQAKAKVVLEREARNAKGTTRCILPLTPERIDAVRRAFKYMLSVCDGAHARDGQGFNKPDAILAHLVLSSGLEQPDELNAAYWMLTRYHRQLFQREPLLFRS